MIHVYHEGGPAGMVQISRREGVRPWITLWHGGFTAMWPGKRLLCFRTPSERAYFSERNGIDVRHLFKVGGWRLFVREDHA